MSKKVTYEGPGFLSLLTLLFIGLKLAEVIDWSWYWVLSPIWLPIMLLLIVGLIWGCLRGLLS